MSTCRGGASSMAWCAPRTKPLDAVTGRPSWDMQDTVQPSSGWLRVQWASTSHGPTASSSSTPSNRRMAMWRADVLGSWVLSSACLGWSAVRVSSLEDPRSLTSSFSGGVGECRGRLAADDGRGLVDELVVLEGLHHEQGEVHAARDVALEDGVAHVSAPHGQALTLALLEVAAAHDGPPRVAGEHPPARLHLVVEVGEASETRERGEDLHDRLELPRIHVLAVARDVPPAREDEARARRRVVEHRLGRSR